RAAVRFRRLRTGERLAGSTIGPHVRYARATDTSGNRTVASVNRNLQQRRRAARYDWRKTPASISEPVLMERLAPSLRVQPRLCDSAVFWCLRDMGGQG